jgi:hypothetical protein
VIYEVVYCSDCKKPIKSAPSWLATVNVRFTCESCRQRHPRGVLGLDPPAGARVVADADADHEDVLVEPGEIVVEDEVSLDEVEADPDAVDEPLVGAIIE